MKRLFPALVAAAVLVLLVVWRNSLIRSHADRTGEPRGRPGTGPGAPRTQFVSIGTGGVTGVYYQVGGAIMKLVNAKQAEYGLRVSFQATGGSVYNINAVLKGDLDVGVAQSDRQSQALNGQGEWAGKGKASNLRAICSLHPEAVTVVAATDSGILSLQDMKGKRVNIGNPGSGTRGNALDVLAAAGLNLETDLRAEGLKAAESAKLLQDGRIDAFFYTVGHPAGAITEATAGRREIRLVPVIGMEQLLAEHPYYASVEIPLELYPRAQNDRDVPTVAVMTTLVTSTAVDDNVIYAITKEIFENLPELRSMHPAFARLAAADMVSKGLSAPIHAGATRYYREAGLME